MYSLKGIKTFQGMEGTGLNANIYWDGKKIGNIIDDGDGGETIIHFISKDAEFAFTTHCNQWWETSSDKVSWEKDNLNADDHDKMDCWINAEINRIDLEKRLKKHAKTKTPYKLVGEEDWRLLAIPFSPKVEEALQKKYGDKLEAIYHLPVSDAPFRRAFDFTA
jgi:hypothetical protein